ncbi:hypothetical protein [Streptomyces vietnamensis]|uniref:hypothetical protein n=1 Tax=Streptomyces vietnamensis TaxID=362257 RepID=UPI000A818251
MPGKITSFLRATDLGPAERATLDQGVVRRGQGYTLRVTAVLDELGRAAEEVRITRKTLLELPDPGPPAPSASAPELPDGAAYQEIMAVFAQADGPLRARGVCEAMDLDPAPNNINNVRLKLKRLTGRNILTEPEPGLFTCHVRSRQAKATSSQRRNGHKHTSRPLSSRDSRSAVRVASADCS